jgi:hypothetical protein
MTSIPIGLRVAASTEKPDRRLDAWTDRNQRRLAFPVGLLWLAKVQMTRQDAGQNIIDAVRRAFHTEPRLGPRFSLDRITVDGDGMLTLEGNVARLADKKLALLRAASAPGVIALVDHVQVAPLTPMGDRHIRAHLREMFAQDPSFSDLELREDVASGVFQTEFCRIRSPEGSADMAQESILPRTVCLAGRFRGTR